MAKNYAQFLNSIPVIPDIASKVLHMTEEGRQFSFHDLEQTISLDPGLTSKILRVANSALYARQKEITQLSTAITLLGFNTIKSLVILVTGASLFDKFKKFPFYKYYWKHSISTAFFAKELAIKIGKRNVAEQAFVAGLIHNIGQVALFSGEPENYEELLKTTRKQGNRISVVETQTYGVNHKEIGYQVLTEWNFPDVYTETAKEHGNENITSSHKLVVILVSTADFLASNLDFFDQTPLSLDKIAGYLPYIGLKKDELEAWNAEFLQRLSQDKLFLECQSLFQ